MLFHFSIHSSDALIPTVVTYSFLTIKHAIEYFPSLSRLTVLGAHVAFNYFFYMYNFNF